jgi:hypothetical protein
MLPLQLPRIDAITGRKQPMVWDTFAFDLTVHYEVGLFHSAERQPSKGNTG